MQYVSKSSGPQYIYLFISAKQTTHFMETKLITRATKKQISGRIKTHAILWQAVLKSYVEVLPFKKHFGVIVFITCRKSEDGIDTIRNSHM